MDLSAIGWGWDNGRPLIGIALIIFVCWALSEARNRFPFRLVLGALAAQAVLVWLLFGFPETQPVIQAITGVVDGLTAATQQGTQFVFGYLANLSPNQPYVLNPQGGGAPFIFAFQVLPLILVISALSALLWHWRILRWIIAGFGFVFRRFMGIGGASAMAVAANIFMGMVESPIVIRAYLDRLTRSELFMMMVVGLATVAGSAMVAYILVLKQAVPDVAAHILVASIISAPAGILLARVMIPEAPGEGPTEDDDTVVLRYQSSMDAITRGVQDGLQVCLNIAATLIVFVSLVTLVNLMLAPIGDVAGAPVTLERIFGYVFAPLAYMIGVPWDEAVGAGNFLGVKLFLTEFIAYVRLGEIAPEALSERTRVLLAYALCGFANVGSVGILVSGLAVLLPDRRSEVLELAWKALTPGFLATCMTAAVVAAMPGSMFGF